MKKRFLGQQVPALFTIFTLLVAFTAISRAEDNDFRPPYNFTSVSRVISGNYRHNGQDIVLIGRVLRESGDTYLFTDGTGKVKLDGEDIKLPVGPLIIVGGRVDWGFLGLGSLEIDVHHWHLFGGNRTQGTP